MRTRREQFADFLAAIVVMILFLWAAWGICEGAETKPWQPVIVGTGMMTATIPFTSDTLSWGHSIELEGWSYAATDVFGRIIGDKNWWAAPLFVAMLDGLYRAGEKNSGNQLMCDYLGILGATTVHFDWGL